MGPWADMIRMRIDVRRRRLGIGRERPSLRCDLFGPPGAAVRGGEALPSPPSLPSLPSLPSPAQGTPALSSR